ncbi:MAG: hypothetical protein IM638_13785 [Bacteroidetes bacterium]|nr:hypothetical protein [Bacteroidota bacterium]
MKRLPLFAAAASLLLIASCAKDQTNYGLSKNGSFLRTTDDDNNNPGDLNKTEFNLTLVKDPLTQEWYCAEPMSDCARTSITSSRMNDLDNMIENNTLETYFSARTNVAQLPMFNHKPEIISGLAQGHLTLVRQSNSNGDVFYMVVKKGTVTRGAQPRSEQIIHTIMISASDIIPSH